MKRDERQIDMSLKQSTCFLFKSRDISTGVHFTKSAGSDAMVSSNTFCIDCISNLSD